MTHDPFEEMQPREHEELWEERVKARREHVAGIIAKINAMPRSARLKWKVGLDTDDEPAVR